MSAPIVGELAITGLTCPVRLGCTDAERAFPQLVRVDLRARVLVSAAILSDDVGDTLDYAQAADSVGRLLAEREWRLLETLAHDIAREVHGLGSKLEQVTVTVTKQILANAEGVSFTVTI